MPTTPAAAAAPPSAAPPRASRVGAPPDPRQALGALGERVAERWLVARGWRVLARRFRSGHRDLDLVVSRSGLVAFVEVKTRRAPAAGGSFADPLEAVHWRKRRELVRSAQVWIARHGPAGAAYRFDVVGVAFALGARPAVRVRHVADAFQVPS
jgi:putative endonuclease